jgi:antitoxin (DNA-binding transcriptional repressor) of toxin-antitoxin stability system
VDVNLGDARHKLDEIVQNVLDGEDVTIFRNGKPVVDLVRTKGDRLSAPKFGTMKGRIIIKDPDWHKAPETDDGLASWLKGEVD